MNPISMKDYFSRILERLGDGAKAESRSVKPSFADLKMMEYWVRLLRVYPNGRCGHFFNSFFDKKQSFLFIKLLADRFLDLPELKKIQVFGVASKVYSLSEGIRLCVDSGDTSWVKPIMTAFCIQQVSSEIASAMIVLVEDFTRESIRRGCPADDISMRNAFELKRTFCLSDEALELVLYLWLKDEKKMVFSLFKERDEEADCSFDEYSRGTFLRIREATGFGVETLRGLCDGDSPLRKFRIIDTDEKSPLGILGAKNKGTELHLVKDISDFLYGYAGNKKILDYKEAELPTVSFEQIALQNSSARFVLQFLQDRQKAKVKTPFHVLFYGREGTGKTELAKAIAVKLGERLLNVGMGNENNDNETRLQNRVRSLLMADYECQKSGGIILMDEADLVLNRLEKGFLNTLFESIKTPVIWIANSLDCVSNSTRRRFNYAIEFGDFGREQRKSVWKSVLKTQDAEDLLSENQLRNLAEEIPIMAGTMTLAVQQAKLFGKNAFEIVQEVTRSHAKLLNIPCSAKISESDEGDYDAAFLRFEEDGLDLPTLEAILQNFNGKWIPDGNENLNLLLYGPPGTGKTAFVKNLAKRMGRKLVMKHSSDLLHKYVGDTEKAIRESFSEAEKVNAILFLDEADSLLESRENADRHWEVTKVNEFICQMDGFRGLFIAATNYMPALDFAVRRRFHLKMGFAYMTPSQMEKAWKKFFAQVLPQGALKNFPVEILQLSNVSISDFSSVKYKLRYMPTERICRDLVVEMLREEITSKDNHHGRKMGL